MRRQAKQETEAFGEANAEAFGAFDGEAAGEDRVEESGRTHFDLALSKRMKSNDLHAAGQGIGELWNEQHVCRSGHEETARRTISIDGDLEGREEARDTLDFVEDRTSGQVCHESHRVGFGGFSQDDVIEVEVGVPMLSPTLRASVVLPHWRGPWMSTTGVSSRASSSRLSTSRGLTVAGVISANRNVRARLIARFYIDESKGLQGHPRHSVGKSQDTHVSEERCAAAQ